MESVRPLLLFYDTKEKDLARDLNGFLEVLGVKVTMISRSPDRGLTLDAKEQACIDEASGAVVLITPGSERGGRQYPSPSVADEMGQSKQRFRKTPEALIYLVDSTCSIQAVDQRSYIRFDRSDIRTVLEALTQLIRDLRAAGAFAQQKIEPRKTPGVDVAQVAATLESNLKEICAKITEKPNGMVSFVELDLILKQTLKMDEQTANFAKRDLQTKGLVTYLQQTNYWTLTPIGWEIARLEAKRRSEDLAELRKILQPPGNTFHQLLDANAQQPPPKGPNVR